jgi:hypothetical protein
MQDTLNSARKKRLKVEVRSEKGCWLDLIVKI